MSRPKHSFAMAAALLLVGIPANAGGQGDVTGRALVGFSHTSVEKRVAGAPTSISGFGLMVEGAVGGRLTENLCLFGTGMLLVMPKDTVHVDGRDLWLLEHDTLIWGIGFGLSYHLPHGFWIGADVRLGSLRPFASEFEMAEVPGTPSEESDAGFIVDGMVGWAHDVAADVHLGIATWIIYTTHGTDGGTAWSGFTFGAAATLHFR